MEKLPVELLCHIAYFLDPLDIVRLQAVSKCLFKITRDNQLWKLLCFEYSRARTDWGHWECLSTAPVPIHQPPSSNIQGRERGLSQSNGALNGNHSERHVRTPCEQRKMRALANWDPEFPTEKVDWYSEYIARHAPISMSWLQQPAFERGEGQGRREIRGMSLLDTEYEGHARRVVAPLDDGSVCLWDLNIPETTSDSRQGQILARSKPGLLSVHGPKGRSWQNSASTRAEMTSTGVVECVSVDNFRKTAYFAVQSGLNEIDLETLQVISHERYPFSISALSEAKHPLPLTVGTTLSLHLHDSRLGQNARYSDHSSNCLDQVATFPSSPRSQNDFHRLLSGDPMSEPAPLFQPGPLSILHLGPVNESPSDQGEIFVAGRFPSILIYDRRIFPRLRTTIHSGARLCSLASLPYPFSSLECDLMRQNQLSTEDVRAVKDRRGSTLIGCGEYNGKGSLELYGLRSECLTNDTNGGRTLDSTLKNRVSASRSKLLSVATHGTRIVFSDSDGMLKWVERDGSTLVRRWNINQYYLKESRGLFASSGLEASTGDVARKILTSRRRTYGRKYLAQEDLLVWTGERIGLLNYSTQPTFSIEDIEEKAESVEEALKRREEKIYGLTMRRALERQADEVRFVKGLGLGSKSA